ncbi:MAG TPA: hypothetical protein VGR82_19480 [Methylomirabilota bacterium]|jgi:hypothetical protein|nr:hypothetical protein [Methylomirabilota bacterium]
MKGDVSALAALALLLIPATALAQAPASRETQLQQEIRHRRVIVRPATPPADVQQDVDQATTEIERRARENTVVRDLTRPTPPPHRRPELDYDVKSGIQQRALQDALRR